MKITFVLPDLSLAGGIRVIAIFAEELQRRGHQVEVAHWAAPRLTVRQIGRSIVRKRAWPNRPDVRSHFDRCDLPLIRLRYRAAVTDHDLPDADVVVATWWETADPVASLSSRKGAKAYFMQDYGAPGQELPYLQKTWKHDFQFITIAEWLAALIREQSPSARIAVVPNAVDAERFNAPPRDKQPTPTVGFIYRSMHSKGCDIATEALKIARAAVPDLAVRVVGEEPPPPDLPSFASYQRGITDEGLREVYSACDAWIFPSRREGYGLPISEAMACRTPVIATPAGAAPDLVPGAGVLLNTFDAGEMAQAIITMASMPALEWRQLSRAARTRVADYGWAAATDLFEAALQRAAEHG